jgi:ubiquinone/menaquinone biosynthesis C-methylase UbiE
MSEGHIASRTGESENDIARRVFSGLPRHYDALAEALSFGQNRRWRKTMVDQIAAANPATILDVATGTAGVALDLARRTQASITGIDLTESMLQRGREKVAAQGYSQRISLTIGRAEELPFPDSAFGALTFTYLLRYVADPEATLREMGRVPGVNRLLHTGRASQHLCHCGCDRRACRVESTAVLEYSRSFNQASDTSRERHDHIRRRIDRTLWRGVSPPAS